MRRGLDGTAADGMHVAIRKLDATAATSRASAVDDSHHAGAAADRAVLSDRTAAGPHATVQSRLHQNHFVWQTLRLKHFQAAVFSPCTEQPTHASSIVSWQRNVQRHTSSPWAVTLRWHLGEMARLIHCIVGQMIMMMMMRRFVKRVLNSPQRRCQSIKQVAS